MAEAPQMADQQEGAEPRLRFAPFMSERGAWAYGVGTAIGWGSFVVTSNSYLLEAGPVGSVIGMLIGVAIMVIIAWNYSYLMKRYPSSGGAYTYAKSVLGNDYGFLVAWFLALTYLAVFWANATSLPVFCEYFIGDLFRFGYLYTIFGYDVYVGEVLLTAGAIVAVGLLCRGDKKAKERVMVGLVALLTVGIVVVASYCIFSNLTGAGPHSGMKPLILPTKNTSELILQISSVTLMTPWAFIGFESISHSSEEFSFPRSKSFRVLMAVVVTTTVLYVVVLLLSVSAHPSTESSWYTYLRNLGSFDGIEGLPAFFSAGYYLGDLGVGVLVLSLLALVITSLIGNLVALSRLIHALALDEIVSPKLAVLNERGAPINAGFAICVVSIVVTFLGRTAIGWVVDLTTIGTVIVYGIVSYASSTSARESHDKGSFALGVLGIVLMVVFGLIATVPSLVGRGSLEQETFFMLTVWCILGFVYFRLLLARDKDGKLGRSVIVWVALLAFVLFSAMVWMREAEHAQVVASIDRIRDHLNSDHHLREAYIRSELLKLDDVNLQSSLMTIGFFVMAVVMMIGNYRIMSKRNDSSRAELGEVRSVAYRDSLTGVKSKNAYADWVAGINDRISHGAIAEFAVVVFDLNDLKRVNDTQGHEAGDEYIRQGCMLACRHFKHSPVFRIGGDEFVAILEGKDFEQRQFLIMAFNEEVELNLKEDKPVVAAGMSDFRRDEDLLYLDVFVRADANMYHRKEVLKALAGA